MRVRDILAWIDTVAPFKYAEPWDNVGLQIGNPDEMVHRVLCALDPSSYSIDEAKRLNCDCLVVHHPLFLEGIKSLNASEYPQRYIFELIRHGISLIVAHTNLDVSKRGGNQLIAEFLDLQDIRPLDGNPKFVQDSNYVGMGIIGRFVNPCSTEELSEKLGNLLNIDRVNLVGEFGKTVRTVAVCTGSGGSLLKKVFSYGVDCFVTGEIKYHDTLWAKEVGLSVIALGHFYSEKFMMTALAKDLKYWSLASNDPIDIFEFQNEKDYVETLSLRAN